MELSLDPECSVAEVARSFEVMPAQIYRWRVDLRETAQAEAREDDVPMFLPVVMEPEVLPATRVGLDRQEARLLPDALVQVAMEVRGVSVLVAHGADPDTSRLGDRGAESSAMIGPGSGAKVLICTRPIDFRCGIDTLIAKVQHELGKDPWGGVVYVFRSKRSHLPTFRIRFAPRNGRLSLASVLRDDDAGGAVSPRQAPQAYNHRIEPRLL